MSARRKKKDEKPPPATGPGSKIVSLPDPVKKYLKKLPDGKKIHLKFGNGNWKSLPVEIYDNEEISQLAIKFTAENNRLKRLPKSIAALENLEHIDITNNTLSAFPGSVSRMKKLEVLIIKNNAIKKLPPAIHKCTGLQSSTLPIIKSERSRRASEKPRYRTWTYLRT